jgi:hypothetical protein
MNHEQINTLLEQAARKGGQEALAKHDKDDDNMNVQKWSAIILAIIGICGFFSGILFFVINSQLDRRVAPIELDMAIIKNDALHVKTALEEIKSLIQGKR